MNSVERRLPRREFLKNSGLAVVGLAVTLLLSGDNRKVRTNSEDSDLFQAIREKRLLKEGEMLVVNLSKDTWAARLLASNQEGSEESFGDFRPEGSGPYLVWRLPLSVEGCEEVSKYRTYQTFGPDELGPHSCDAQAKVFYADWAKEGEGAWRVFVTGGNPDPGGWCSLLSADCDNQDVARTVLEKLTEGGRVEEAWCTNVNQCLSSGGEVVVPPINACKPIEDIYCRIK